MRRFRRARFECLLVLDRLAVDRRDDITRLDTRIGGGGSVDGAPDRYAVNDGDSASDRSKQQQERDDSECEVVRHAGRVHPGLGATVGAEEFIFVGFDERPSRKNREQDEPHRLDFDVFNAAEDAVTALVDDEADEEAEDDFGSDRQREEIVDPRNARTFCGSFSAEGCGLTSA